MLLLNLGCGTKTSSRSEVINIDWSPYLRLRQSRIMRSVAPLLLRGARLDRFNSLPDHVMAHDLRKGIPFASNSSDVVYHSHLLEHLDRDVAPAFLLEVKRVLKPGGVHRIVVPDFGMLCKGYVDSLSASEADAGSADRHESFVAAILEQSVRREAHGTSRQSPLRRQLETRLLGDARKRGETHQWMYDSVTLPALLRSLDYEKVKVRTYNTSYIPDWTSFGLDVDDHGTEYKPGSLYVEAKKPAR